MEISVTIQKWWNLVLCPTHYIQSEINPLQHEMKLELAGALDNQIRVGVI
jgi:hypothetical protein